MGLSLAELAVRLHATLEGDGTVEVTACAPVETAGPGDVAFVANSKYLKHLTTTRASAVIVRANMKTPAGVNRLVCSDPYFGFRNAVVHLHGERVHPQPMDVPLDPKAGSGAANISATARVHRSAAVGEGCVVHPLAVVERSARIGRDCVLYPGAYVGEKAVLGDGCILFPHAVVYDRCVLGNRVTLHAGTCIGVDGFGYATHAGAHHKIPQAGIVVVEDDVEMGANCAVERATIGETRIGAGTKCGDLVNIGHGTTVGKRCLFVGLVGIAGSAVIGDDVVLAGQVGVGGHLRVGHKVMAMAKTGITSSVPDGQSIGGMPWMPRAEAQRNLATLRNLAELAKRVRALEKELERRSSV